MHAPTVIDYEVWHAIRSLNLGGKLTEERGRAALSDFSDLPIQRWPASEVLHRRAFTLRYNLTAYDAAYVALAEVLECCLLTRDVRLTRATGHHATIEVV